eukprot:c20038_g4_i1.p1 GENE.c20038_g4_i1~~c20038_g4_i1.p1  ORF type:complete len:556 (+),score=126.20 c20038_g4_i1:26-1669(+)
MSEGARPVQPDAAQKDQHGSPKEMPPADMEILNPTATSTHTPSSSSDNDDDEPNPNQIQNHDHSSSSLFSPSPPLSSSSNINNNSVAGWFRAIRVGDVGLVQSLQNAIPHVNITNQDGWSGLMIASYGGNLFIVNHLLSLPAIDTSLTNQDGDNAFDLAARVGHSEICDAIKQHATINSNTTNSNNNNNNHSNGASKNSRINSTSKIRHLPTRVYGIDNNNNNSHHNNSSNIRHSSSDHHSHHQEDSSSDENGNENNTTPSRTVQRNNVNKPPQNHSDLEYSNHTQQQQQQTSEDSEGVNQMNEGDDAMEDEQSENSITVNNNNNRDNNNNNNNIVEEDDPFNEGNLVDITVPNVDDNNDADVDDNKAKEAEKVLLDAIQDGKGMKKLAGVSNVDIDKLMLPIKKLRYLGTPSLDNIKKLSISDNCCFIYNTEKGTTSGHWCACIIKDNNIEIFDPLANDVQPSVLKDIRNKLKKGFYQLKINSVKRQKNTTTTCGMHSMKFITDRLLKNKTFKEATGFDIIEDSLRGEKELEPYMQKIAQFGRIKI